MSYLAYIALALFGMVCFWAGAVYEVQRQGGEIELMLYELQQFIKDDSYGKKENSEEENHKKYIPPSSFNGGEKTGIDTN